MRGRGRGRGRVGDRGMVPKKRASRWQEASGIRKLRI